MAEAKGEKVLRQFAAAEQGKYHLSTLLAKANYITQLRANTDRKVFSGDATAFEAVHNNLKWLAGDDNAPKAPGLQYFITWMTTSPVTQEMIGQINAWLDRAICYMDEFGTNIGFARARAIEGSAVPVVDAEGTQRWYDEQYQLHRDNDKPAVITTGGDQVWYEHGKINRTDDKPAKIDANGT